VTVLPTRGLEIGVRGVLGYNSPSSPSNRPLDEAMPLAGCAHASTPTCLGKSGVANEGILVPIEAFVFHLL
jgi:hypothetical protein